MQLAPDNDAAECRVCSSAGDRLPLQGTSSTAKQAQGQQEELHQGAGAPSACSNDLPGVGEQEQQSDDQSDDHGEGDDDGQGEDDGGGGSSSHGGGKGGSRAALKAQRKAAKKAAKAEKREARDSLRGGRPCDLCSKSVDMLIRCQVREREDKGGERVRRGKASILQVRGLGERSPLRGGRRVVEKIWQGPCQHLRKGVEGPNMEQ